ncbi:hypothetical protein K438DRAFT_2019268 [Mycena galopus ATCC 62051]|nr:hypothetical protein K438DRAFT_2019268 [Mycena galopus ATCC 62051]
MADSPGISRVPASGNSSFQDRVPNELWLNTLKNLPPYPKSVISNFSLTCRNFLHLSRPQMFCELRFTPHSLDLKGALLPPSAADVDRRLERLDFFSSSEIAPFVRDCHISVWETYDKDNSSKQSLSTDTPYILLEALFQRLVYFTGLQRFEAHHIHFTQAGVNNLCGLPNLSQLHLSDCPVAPGEHIEPSPHALRLSEFYLFRGSKLGQVDDYWFPMLQPDQLRVLTSNFALGRTAHALPSFNNVHTLEAIMHSPTPAQYLTIMSKFPAVRTLKLHGKGLQPDGVAPTVAVFPLLEEYYGPHEALPFFLATTLRRVQTECGGAEDLSIRIQGIQGRNMTSLNVKIGAFNTTAFNKIVELLPRLTQLLITTGVSDLDRMFTRMVYDPRKLPNDVVVDGRFGDEVRTGFKPSTFFVKLASVPFLPPALERLAICWDCYDDESCFELSAYKVPDFPQLRDALVARCPGLTWLWLHGIYFRFEWRDPMPDGTMREFTAKNFTDSYVQWGEIFHDWDIR